METISMSHAERKRLEVFNRMKSGNRSNSFPISAGWLCSCPVFRKILRYAHVRRQKSFHRSWRRTRTTK